MGAEPCLVLEDDIGGMPNFDVEVLVLEEFFCVGVVNVPNLGAEVPTFC